MSRSFPLASLSLAVRLAGGLIVASCATEQLAPVLRGEPRHLILISIDALRADRLGCYGYDRETSPFLDSLATRGVVFDQAVVNTHGTTPSHTTMLSGLYQESHRVGMSMTRFGLTGQIPESVRLLPELLRDAGFTTLAFTDGGNAGRHFGFDRGFDEFNDIGGGLRRTVPRVERALDLLELEGHRLFLFVHTYDVHSPYGAPPEIEEMFLRDEGSTFEPTSKRLQRYAGDVSALSAADLRRISDLYDAGIRKTDRHLERLFEVLAGRGLLEDALVVVTSDHGEELGEHGGLLHRGLLYDELLRVPLIVLGATVEPSHRQDAASTVDIVPTVLATLGVESPSGLEGVDLFADSYVSLDSAISQYGSSKYAVRTPSWKLIESPEEGLSELYDLRADPLEQNNVLDEHPGVVQSLRRTLRHWRSQPRPDVSPIDQPDLPEDELRRLEALGYVVGSAGGG